MSRHDSPKEIPLSKERLEEAEHWWTQDRRPAGPWTPNQTWNLICDLVREIKRQRKVIHEGNNQDRGSS